MNGAEVPHVLGLVDLVGDNGLHIGVRDNLLLVREALELVDKLVDLLRAEVLVAKLLEARTVSVLARVLAKDELVGGEAHRLGAHDLVGLGVLEYTVLVDACLVRKGVLADDGLVWLHEHTGERAHHTASPGDAGSVHGGVHVKLGRARADRHDNLLDGGVACALPDAVDGDLDLASSAGNASKRVGSGEAQVVVAVGGPDDLVRARRVGNEVLEEALVLGGGGKADRVWDVDRPGAGGNHLLEHLAEEVRVAAASVLGGELDVFGEAGRVRDGLGRLLDALVAGDLELVLEVNIAGGQEGVDAVERRVLDRVIAALDVLLRSAAEAADAHGLAGGLAAVHDGAHLLGDGLHGLEVPGRSDGEAGLAHVDAKAA
mmetsp:Transcript_3608/g.8915  ORF Transcript_3608/g.8915 Transcript_3608/m.8915 type:complete len:374 (+) Transcript_3608:750-1871(+)